jgi:hypothetical protein
MLTDENRRKIWQQNLKEAATELTWENEKKILQEIFWPFI